MEPLYDEIGRGYAEMRRPDARIAAVIRTRLGDARSVVNVGAGTGSYEPVGPRVVAVEPSVTMIRRRSPQAAPAVRAVAEQLPFADGAFDAALAILTIHHWTSQVAGLAELCRVARRRVLVLTWDPTAGGAFWLTREYLPAVVAFDLPRFLSMAELRRHLGSAELVRVPIPHDCTDGFLGAYWRRPEAYLDPARRAAISTLAQLPAATLEPGLRRLEDDLRSGRWTEKFGSLLRRRAIDLGYRLLVAERRAPTRH